MRQTERIYWKREIKSGGGEMGWKRGDRGREGERGYRIGIEKDIEKWNSAKKTGSKNEHSRRKHATKEGEERSI